MDSDEDNWPKNRNTLLKTPVETFSEVDLTAASGDANGRSPSEHTNVSSSARRSSAFHRIAASIGVRRHGKLGEKQDISSKRSSSPTMGVSFGQAPSPQRHIDFVKMLNQNSSGSLLDGDSNDDNEREAQVLTGFEDFSEERKYAHPRRVSNLAFSESISGISTDSYSGPSITPVLPAGLSIGQKDDLETILPTRQVQARPLADVPIMGRHEDGVKAFQEESVQFNNDKCYKSSAVIQPKDQIISSDLGNDGIHKSLSNTSNIKEHYSGRQRHSFVHTLPGIFRASHGSKTVPEFSIDPEFGSQSLSKKKQGENKEFSIISNTSHNSDEPWLYGSQYSKPNLMSKGAELLKTNKKVFSKLHQVSLIEKKASQSVNIDDNAMHVHYPESVTLASSSSYRPGFTYSPASSFNPTCVKSLGLDDVTGVFAFDQLLELFCMSTVHGDLKIISPQYEFILPNNFISVHHWHLHLIPGMARAITFGVNIVDRTEGSHWNDSNGNDSFKEQRLIQIWDFSQFFQTSAKTLRDFVPITIEVPYHVLCLQRIRSSRLYDPIVLYQQCMQNKVASRILDNNQKGNKNTATNSHDSSRSTSPNPSQRNSIYGTKSGETFGSDQERSEPDNHATKTSSLHLPSITSSMNIGESGIARFFTHADNTPFPFGPPINDSRWIFLIGTSEGDLRLLDTYTCKFLDYIVTAENVCLQLNTSESLPDTVLKYFRVSKFVNLPGITSISCHPSEGHLVLIGYSNAMIVLWDFLTHKVARCYLPFTARMVLDLPSTEPMITIQPVSSSHESVPKGLNSDQNPTINQKQDSNRKPLSTLIVPPDFPEFYGPLYLHSLAWNPMGTSFLACISSLIPVSDKYSPSQKSSPLQKASVSIGITGYINQLFNPVLFVFDFRRSLPSMIVSIEHLVKTSCLDMQVPFLFWDTNLKHLKKDSVETHPLLTGTIYFLICEQTDITISGLRHNISFLNKSAARNPSFSSKPQSTFFYNKKSFGGEQSYPDTQTKSNSNHLLASTQSDSRSPINLWKSSGNLCLNAQPIFPMTFTRSMPQRKSSCPYAMTCIQTVIPSPHQSAGAFPVSGTLCGLDYPLDLEKDRGEDADTIIEAANKLSRFLAAGKFFLTLVEFPVRQVIGVCWKIEKEKYKLLCRICPNMIPRLRKNSLTPIQSRTPSKQLSSEPSTSYERIHQSSKLIPSDTEEIENECDSNPEMEESDDEFNPWDTMRSPICFIVNWQSLGLSHVSFCSTIPRFMSETASFDLTKELEIPLFPLYRQSITGNCIFDQTLRKSLTTNLTSRTNKKEGRTLGSGDPLDSFIDALFTVKKKQAVYGWLSGLSGASNTYFISSIPPSIKQSNMIDNDELNEFKVHQTNLKKFEKTDSQMNLIVSRFSQKATDSSLSKYRFKSSDEDTEEDSEEDNEGDEWRLLNEAHFFGDLLRVSKCSWNKDIHSSGYGYWGIGVTGHSDGKVKLWLYGPNGSELLWIFSVITSMSLYPENYLKTDPHHSTTSNLLDVFDLECISAVNSKPVVSCIPDIPIVTCVTVYLAGYQPFMGKMESWFPDMPRYIAIGCMSGDIILFKWTSEASLLSLVEAKYLLTTTGMSPSLSREKMDTEKEMKYYQDIFASKGWTSLLPYGFICSGRCTKHTARITVLHITEVKYSNQQLNYAETQPKKDKSRTSNFFSGIGLTALAIKGTAAIVNPKKLTENVSTLQKSYQSVSSTSHYESSYRLISGDAAGMITIVDVITCEVLAYLPPYQEIKSDIIKPSNLRSTQLGDYTQSVTYVSFITRPFIGIKKNQKNINDMIDQAAIGYIQSDQYGEYFALIGYKNGIIRILNCVTNKFIDTESMCFVTHLDIIESVNLSITTLQSGTLLHMGTLPHVSQQPIDEIGSSGLWEISIKLLLFEEIHIVYSDFIQMCSYYYKIMPTFPYTTLHDKEKYDTLHSRRVNWIDSTVKKKEDILHWFAVVTSQWVGFFEYKEFDTLIPFSPLIPKQVVGIHLLKEALSASLTFINNLPTVIIMLKNGKACAYSFHLNHLAEMDISYLTQFDIIHNLPDIRRAEVLSQLSWATNDWNGCIGFGRRGVKPGPALFLFSNILKKTQQELEELEMSGFYQLKERVASYADYAGINNSLLSLPRHHMATAKQPVQSSVSQKKNKGWAVSIVNKFNQWATDYTKPTVARNLREFIKTAPRQCSAISRDPRLRNRALSSVLITPQVSQKPAYWKAASSLISGKQYESMDNGGVDTEIGTTAKSIIFNDGNKESQLNIKSNEDLYNVATLKYEDRPLGFYGTSQSYLPQNTLKTRRSGTRSPLEDTNQPIMPSQTLKDEKEKTRSNRRDKTSSSTWGGIFMPMTSTSSSTVQTNSNCPQSPQTGPASRSSMFLKESTDKKQEFQTPITVYESDFVKERKGPVKKQEIKNLLKDNKQIGSEKTDAWEEAKKAKRTIQENIMLTKQTADKTEAVNRHAQAFSDLSQALRQKHR